VHIAREVSSAAGSAGFAQPSEPSASVGARLVRAEPVVRTASARDLVDLCSEVGLSARAAQAQRLARASARLTRAGLPAAGPAASRLGGVPDLPAGFEWPRWRGRNLAFLGQINLADVVACVPEAGLPTGGLLLFFYDVEGQPSGLEPSHRDSCRVVAAADTSSVEPDPEERAWSPEYPLTFSRELTLPPEQSLQVEHLGLGYDELIAWSSLRERLAGLQGVALEESSADWFALHRLLGHPEAVHAGEIELDCQLVANGLDLGDGGGYLDPRRDALEPGAADWRLLLQLSADPELALGWGESFRRLYLSIREPALDSGDFGQVWAILR
jgi:uncharacterized protein YwqG